MDKDSQTQSKAPSLSAASASPSKMIVEAAPGHHNEAVVAWLRAHAGPWTVHPPGSRNNGPMSEVTFDYALIMTRVQRPSAAAVAAATTTTVATTAPLSVPCPSLPALPAPSSPPLSTQPPPSQPTSPQEAPSQPSPAAPPPQLPRTQGQKRKMYKQRQKARDRAGEPPAAALGYVLVRVSNAEHRRTRAFYLLHYLPAAPDQSFVRPRPVLVDVQNARRAARKRRVLRGKEVTEGE